MRDDPGQGERATRLEEELRGRCDICGAETIEIHCELICQNCGYTRDCSDP